MLLDLTHKLIEADPNMAVLRALAHPRRLFCDTLYARARMPAPFSRTRTRTS